MNDTLTDLMKSEIKKVIFEYEENNIKNKFNLEKWLRRQNPYFLKQENKNISVKELLTTEIQTYLIAGRRTNFGIVLEKIILHIFNMNKSLLESSDLEFFIDNILYLIQLKSHQWWSNKNGQKRLGQLFAIDKQKMELLYPDKKIICLNFCVNGQEHLTKDGYIKICGERAFELLGKASVYIEILDLLGKESSIMDDIIINKAIEEFKQYGLSTIDDKIDWVAFTKYVSAKKSSKHKISKKRTAKKEKNIITQALVDQSLLDIRSDHNSFQKLNIFSDSIIKVLWLSNTLIDMNKLSVYQKLVNKYIKLSQYIITKRGCKGGYKINIKDNAEQFLTQQAA